MSVEVAEGVQAAQRGQEVRQRARRSSDADAKDVMWS
jgi:hypothetical protein